MSSKQLLRLAAMLAIVLALWGVVALASRRSDDGAAGAPIIPKADTSTVDSIVMAGPADTAVLARGSDSAAGWRVNGHRADQRAVTELLKAIHDSAVAADIVARNPASHVRLRVTEDSGRRVRIVQGKRALVNLVAGKQTTDWDGIYVRQAGQPSVYVVRGVLATALARPADEWRDHTIASIPPDSVAAIEIRKGPRSYTLRRKGSGWVFGSGAAADSAAVAGLLANYREVKATGFATARQADSLRFGRLRRQARLLGKGGAPLLTLEFDSLASGIWVRVQPNERPARTGGGNTPGAGIGEVYRMDSWTAEQLAPPDSALR
jgi:hypothetical protein